MSLRIDLFYLGLDPLVLILPYVSLPLPHVGLLVQVRLELTLTLPLVVLLLLEGADYLLALFFLLLRFLLFFPTEFELTLALVLGDHVIFFLLLVV